VASPGPSRPGRRWCASYSAAGLNGPQRWSTVRRRDRRGPTESAAGQWFLIGDASLGWNPSVRSTIQHASRISNRVLLNAQRHQQTQAANKQTIRTSRTRQPTWRKLWGRTVRPCNLKRQQRDLMSVLRRPVELAPIEKAIVASLRTDRRPAFRGSRSQLIRLLARPLKFVGGRRTLEGARPPPITRMCQNRPGGR
jgi:hypothetical protein